MTGDWNGKAAGAGRIMTVETFAIIWWSAGRGMWMYTVEDFVRRAMASRGLICYGTGKRFQVFVEHFRGTQVLDKVAFCVDRDAGLHGS